MTVLTSLSTLPVINFMNYEPALFQNSCDIKLMFAFVIVRAFLNT